MCLDSSACSTRSYISCYLLRRSHKPTRQRARAQNTKQTIRFRPAQGTTPDIRISVRALGPSSDTRFGLDLPLGRASFSPGLDCSGHVSKLLPLCRHSVATLSRRGPVTEPHRSETGDVNCLEAVRHHARIDEAAPCPRRRKRGPGGRRGEPGTRGVRGDRAAFCADAVQGESDLTRRRLCVSALFERGHATRGVSSSPSGNIADSSHGPLSSASSPPSRPTHWD